VSFSGGIACPECGADNSPGAAVCRLCRALLRPDVTPKRRLQRKILHRTDFVGAARENERRTRRLIALLLSTTATLGYLLGWNLQLLADAAPSPGHAVWFLSGWGIAAAAALLSVGAGWAAIAIRVGDRVVLALTGAKEVSPDEQPQLHNVVEEMAVAAGLPKPRVYVLQTDAMNAFATGLSPRRSAVCVTTGLLRQLNREELQGVVGHELGHIVNLDVRYATVVAVVVGLVALVSDGVLRSVRYGAGRSLQRSARRRPNAFGLLVFAAMVLFALTAPLFAKLVQMAVSRQREFLADATSVRLTRNPAGLISALEKLSVAAQPFKGVNRATQHMFIVNPLRNFSDTASALMATHPPIERRIRRLRYLGPGL
jgi:heat shock protein HtpX